MKIINLKTFTVYAYRTNYIFLKLETDEGIYGLGEGTLEYKENALLGAIEDIKRVIIGKNPMQTEKIYEELYRDSYWRNCAVLQSALSAVEMALWDIKGKFLNVPIYELIGGKVRDYINIYANGWFAGANTPLEFEKAAKKVEKLGVTAIKWDPFGNSYMNIDKKNLIKAMEIIEAVKGAVGNKIDLIIEGHGRFNVETAIKISREISRFDPMFFEEPTPPDSLDALAEVRRKSLVPIAAGERLYTPMEFKNFFEKGCADIVQPDVSHCGGISALKKIAAMAENYYVSVAPHNPSGPISNAATLQLAGNLVNFKILEIMITDVSWRRDLTNEEIVYSDGCIKIPDKSGLGISINEEACQDHPYEPINLRHYKGALTDIRPKENTDYYFEGLKRK